MLHAEHGGGNNSTFVCRALTSSGTDAYSAYSGAIGALKGFRHGGANIKVVQMFEEIKRGVKHWESDEEIKDFLRQIMDKKKGCLLYTSHRHLWNQYFRYRQKHYPQSELHGRGYYRYPGAECERLCGRYAHLLGRKPPGDF